MPMSGPRWPTDRLGGAHRQVVAIGHVVVGRPGLKPRAWSFYILSRRGGVSEPLIGGREVEFFHEIRMVHDFFSQQRDEVETRRAEGVSSPLWQGSIGGARSAPKVSRAANSRAL